MDYTSAIAELLSHHGFRRFMMSQVGHLKLVGHLDGRPIDIVLDTGASKTIVDLSYCRSEGIAVSDTGQPGAGAGRASCRLPMRAPCRSQCWHLEDAFNGEVEGPRRSA
jgi:hypothetical protein